MELLVSLFQICTSFIPRLLHITEDMRGIRMMGASHTLLVPGYYYYIPLIHEVRTCFITRQEIDLPEQILTTTNGDTVLASLSIVYRIHGVIKALINTQDYTSTVTEVAQRAVSEIIGTSTTEEALCYNDQFYDLLIETTQKDLLDYGLKIDQAFFTSIALTSSYHLTGVYLSVHNGE